MPEGFINSYFDKTYVINLDARTDRLKRIDEQLKSLGIEYERFSAIEPKFEQIPKGTWRNFEHREKKYVIGATGCRASHVSILKKAKESGHDRILIIEDDSEISPDVNQICKKSIRQIDSEKLKWDMLYLGGLYEFGGYYVDGSKWYQEFVGPNVLRLKGAMETKAYGISNHNGIFDFVIDNAIPSGYEIDIVYYKMHQHCKQFSYFGAYPVPIKGDGSRSDIK